jgi:hypothetical protein
MISSARKIIRLSLQDLGPIAIPLPTGPVAIPGGIWPAAYLHALAVAILDRGVDVEIALSNPNSVPGPCSVFEANYGNGWTCNDVASEIIKAVKALDRPDVDDAHLRRLVHENLRVTYIRSARGCDEWPDKGHIGNHAKHFLIDDMCFCIGSQNLYIANLAEWGIVVDSIAETQKVMEAYWNPMWANSFERDRDCSVDKVMDGLGIDRCGEDMETASPERQAEAYEAMKRCRGSVCTSQQDDPAAWKEVRRHFGAAGSAAIARRMAATTPLLSGDPVPNEAVSNELVSNDQ